MPLDDQSRIRETAAGKADDYGAKCRFCGHYETSLARATDRYAHCPSCGRAPHWSPVKNAEPASTGEAKQTASVLVPSVGMHEIIATYDGHAGTLAIEVHPVEPASTGEADGAVPAGYRLGDGWEVTRSGLLCWACKPTRRALYLLRDKNTWLGLRSSACGDCAVRLGALVALSPPGEGTVRTGWLHEAVEAGALSPPGEMEVAPPVSEEDCGSKVEFGMVMMCSSACVEAGRHLKKVLSPAGPPGEGTVPVCKTWCGRKDDHATNEPYWQDSTGEVDFCARACAKAGRPLRPAPAVETPEPRIHSADCGFDTDHPGPCKPDPRNAGALAAPPAPDFAATLASAQDALNVLGTGRLRDSPLVHEGPRSYPEAQPRHHARGCLRLPTHRGTCTDVQSLALRLDREASDIGRDPTDYPKGSPLVELCYGKCGDSECIEEMGHGAPPAPVPVEGPRTCDDEGERHRWPDGRDPCDPVPGDECANCGMIWGQQPAVQPAEPAKTPHPLQGEWKDGKYVIPRERLAEAVADERARREAKPAEPAKAPLSLVDLSKHLVTTTQDLLQTMNGRIAALEAELAEAKRRAERAEEAANRADIDSAHDLEMADAARAEVEQLRAENDRLRSATAIAHDTSATAQGEAARDVEALTAEVDRLRGKLAKSDGALQLAITAANANRREADARVLAERDRCLWWVRARVGGVLPLSALVDDIGQGHPIPPGAIPTNTGTASETTRDLQNAALESLPPGASIAEQAAAMERAADGAGGEVGK